MSDFSSSYPNSRKVFVDGPRGIRVPMREVSLERGASSICLYDTSGPQDHDVKDGLPRLRASWVKPRSGCVTQLQCFQTERKDLRLGAVAVEYPIFWPL